MTPTERRIRALELLLAWALGALEGADTGLDLTAAYHELYTPGPIFTDADGNPV
jgi:hypothetical protein